MRLMVTDIESAASVWIINAKFLIAEIESVL